MIEVGAFEAKTYLPSLLKKAAKGETILITNRGKPLAQLGPVKKRNPDEIAKVVSRMLKRRDRRGPKLGKNLTIRQLVEEGRK